MHSYQQELYTQKIHEAAETTKPSSHATTIIVETLASGSVKKTNCTTSSEQVERVEARLNPAGTSTRQTIDHVDTTTECTAQTGYWPQAQTGPTSLALTQNHIYQSGTDNPVLGSNMVRAL